MTVELVKVTVDLYERGAVISAPVTRWIASYDQFHSKRIVFPVEPISALIRTYEDGISMALMDFMVIRLTAIGPTTPVSLTDGELDFLMMDNRLDWLLGENLPRMAAKAVTISPPYRHNRSFCAWLELWEVGRERAKFITDQVDLTRLA